MIGGESWRDVETRCWMLSNGVVRRHRDRQAGTVDAIRCHRQEHRRCCCRHLFHNHSLVHGSAIQVVFVRVSALFHCIIVISSWCLVVVVVAIDTVNTATVWSIVCVVVVVAVVASSLLSVMLLVILIILIRLINMMMIGMIMVMILLLMMMWVVVLWNGRGSASVDANATTGSERSSVCCCCRKVKRVLVNLEKIWKIKLFEKFLRNDEFMISKT